MAGSAARAFSWAARGSPRRATRTKHSPSGRTRPRTPATWTVGAAATAGVGTSHLLGLSRRYLPAISSVSPSGISQRYLPAISRHLPPSPARRTRLCASSAPTRARGVGYASITLATWHGVIPPTERSIRPNTAEIVSRGAHASRSDAHGCAAPDATRSSADSSAEIAESSRERQRVTKWSVSSMCRVRCTWMASTKAIAATYV